MQIKSQTAEIFQPLFKPARYKGAHGGRGCIHADTLIDTPQGHVKVSEFKGGAVYAWCPRTGSVVEAYAEPPVVFSPEMLYRYKFEDGRVIIATKKHKFFTGSAWLSGHEIYQEHVGVFSASPYRTNLDIDQKVLRVNVQHLRRKALNFLYRCSQGLRQCGGLLRKVQGTFRFPSPLRVCGSQHNFHACVHRGVQESGSINDRKGLSRFLLSNRVAPLFAVGKGCVNLENFAFSKTSGWSLGLRIVPLRFLLKTSRKPLALKFCQLVHDSFLEFLNNLARNLQALLSRPLRTFCDKTFITSSKINLIHHYSKIVEISKHGVEEFYDFTVRNYHNYFAEGMVHHNSSKSWMFADMLIDRCLDGGVNAVCCREIQKSLDQSVKKLLELTIERLGVGSLFKVLENRIVTPGKGNIIFQGLQNHTADSIKSLEGYDIAWIEEAQTISQRSLDLLRPTIRKDKSELWFSWNPLDESDPIDVFLRGEDPPKDCVVIEANFMDNPWFPDVLWAEMEGDKKRDYGKYLHVWEGKYLTLTEARVFKNWEVKEFETSKNALFRFGADFGFANDPTVMVRCYIEGRNLYFDYEAWEIGCGVDFTPDLFRTIPESTKWPCVADCARPETIDYLNRHGFPQVRGAVKGKNSINEGVEYLKSYDIVIHPRCKNLIEEFKRYSYKTDPLTGAVLPVFEDKWNHCIDASRYACESARHASVSFDDYNFQMDERVY